MDLGPLVQYLKSDQAPADCMGLSDLDGFLTGVVVGPVFIPISEWLPAVWRGAEPGFGSAEQESIVTWLITRLHHEIAMCFQLDPEHFSPIFLEAPDGAMIVTDWAAGFLDAIALRPALWSPMRDDPRASLMLEPLRVLGRDESLGPDRGKQALKRRFYEERPGVIATCVNGIHAYWGMRRAQQHPQPRRRLPRR